MPTSDVPEETPPAPRIEPYGDGALRIVVDDRLDARVNRRACALGARVAAAAADGRLPGVTDVVPAFAMVGVHFDAERVLDDGPEGASAKLARLLAPLLVDADDASDDADARLIDIPVCYGGAFGPDLDALAAAQGTTADALVALHTGPREVQRVYMIGFAPGAPYIGRLDPAFAVPRRATPRTSMPPGSVCVANRQTVIYPVAAPGGWTMIGRTPLKLFDAERAEPFLLKSGDRIRFRAIEEATFARAVEAS